MARKSKKIIVIDERISQEIKKLEEIFYYLPEDKKRAANLLIERMAFMKVTLENLEEMIKQKGAVYKFEQGAQKMLVENPAQKSYNTMINRYTSSFEKLMNLIPKEGTTVKTDEDSDGFDEFVNARD